jgi:hypothetical protein
MSWYRWRDSNPHCLVSKTSASSQLGYTGKTFLIFDCRLIRDWQSDRPRESTNQKSAIGNVLVDLARFERATSTFAESRSDSAELQVREIFDLRFLIADLLAWQALSNWVLIKNLKSKIKNYLAEGTGLEPASDERGSFQVYCLTS